MNNEYINARCRYNMHLYKDKEIINQSVNFNIQSVIYNNFIHKEFHKKITEHFSERMSIIVIFLI